MATEIKVPELPESVADATVATWHKKPGDVVKRDENLVDLETDKVVLEVPAPTDGVLGEYKAAEGDTVVGGDLLGSIEEGEASSSAEVADDEQDNADDADNNEADSRAADKLSPAVKKLIVEHDLDPTEIIGSGKDGRLLKSDVEAWLKKSSQGSAQKAMDNDSPLVRVGAAGEGEGTEAEEAGVIAAAVGGAPSGKRVEQRVPMTRLRKRIAERLLDASNQTAMLTTFNEVDMTAVLAMRSRYKEQFEREHGTKLGFMSFFVKASIEALKKFPAVNASIDGDDIIYHGYFDVGIAVSTERGLVVPILRNADALGFADVEKGVTDFGLRAREGKLSMDDLTGGTFSITNGGVFGSMMSTPILNPPQSAILGMHATKERPMVVDGEIKIRPMMYLALSYDHRIIDGKEAVQALVTIKECLEDPGRLLLQL